MHVPHTWYWCHWAIQWSNELISSLYNLIPRSPIFADSQSHSIQFSPIWRQFLNSTKAISFHCNRANIWIRLAKTKHFTRWLQNKFHSIKVQRFGYWETKLIFNAIFMSLFVLQFYAHLSRHYWNDTDNTRQTMKFRGWCWRLLWAIHSKGTIGQHNCHFSYCYASLLFLVVCYCVKPLSYWRCRLSWCLTLTQTRLTL